MATNKINPPHYTGLKIDPYEYALENNLGFLEGNVVKYLSRWKQKNGVEDLKKAKETLERLINHAEAEANLKNYEKEDASEWEDPRSN